jgi:hypothetical protein
LKIHPPEWLYTLVRELVATVMADKAGDKDADKEMDLRRTNADFAKWSTVPPKHAEGEMALNITQQRGNKHHQE